MSHQLLSLQLDILDEENEHEDSNIGSMAAAIAASRAKRQWHPSMYRQHLDWKKHTKRLKKECQFDQMYHMHYTFFYKLLSLLSPALKVNKGQGMRRSHGSGHISEVLILHCLIRYMAGGSFHNIHMNSGMAKSTFFRCFIGVLMQSTASWTLINIFPTDSHGLKVVALEYQNRSSNGVLDGCIRALDGGFVALRCQHRKKHLTFQHISQGTINAMECTSRLAVMHIVDSPGFPLIHWR